MLPRMRFLVQYPHADKTAIGLERTAIKMARSTKLFLQDHLILNLFHAMPLNYIVQHSTSGSLSFSLICQTIEVFNGLSVAK